MFSSLTALELKAEEFQRRTAFYDSSINRWTVQLPWIDEDPEARRLTDNSGRAIAMGLSYAFPNSGVFGYHAFPLPRVFGYHAFSLHRVLGPSAFSL